MNLLLQNLPDFQYASLRIICGLLCFFYALTSLKKSFEVRPAMQVAFVCFTMGWWNLIFGISQIVPTITIVAFLEPLKYLGVALAPLALFYYSFTYAGYENKIFMRIAAVIPLLTCLFSLSNYYHSFFLVLDDPVITYTPVRSVNFSFGIWFAIHSLYSYVLMLATIIFFLIKISSKKTKNRFYLYVMIGSVFTFLIFNVLSTFMLNITITLKLISAALQCITASSFFWTFYFDSNENTIFLGRKKFFETMFTPVLLFNNNHELIFYNEAASALNGFQSSALCKYQSYDTVFSKNRFSVLLQTVEGFFLCDNKKAGVYFCNKNPVTGGGKKNLGYSLSLYEMNSLDTLLLELEQKMYFDTVWDCFNRTYYEKNIRQLIGSLEKPFTVMTADIDKLKQVNDTFGHDIGNEYIKNCITLLRSVIRNKDLMFKTGGDEFVLLLPKINEKDAVDIRKRLDAAIEKQLSPSFFGISIGYSVVSSDTKSFNEHFDQADKMMYAEKKRKKQNI